jgi:hypothetical protein
MDLSVAKMGTKIVNQLTLQTNSTMATPLKD